jgi:hypothetical protein
MQTLPSSLSFRRFLNSASAVSKLDMVSKYTLKDDWSFLRSAFSTTYKQKGERVSICSK